MTSAKAKISRPELERDLSPLSSPPTPVALTPTPLENSISQRLADFGSLTMALDYAADGETGYNFYDARGKLKTVLSYKTLRDHARLLAQHLSAKGLSRGSHVALVADTSPEFVLLFFACRYAGLVPYAMPIPVNLGSHAAYISNLKGMLERGQAGLALANEDFIHFLEEAAEGLEGIEWIGTPAQLEEGEPREMEFLPNHPSETAYIQFTSGSTKTSRAVVITEHALMSNLQGIVRHGIEMNPKDRCASWLPFYHDMGLVGLLLSPLMAQLSVDFLPTYDFAIRPLQWLKIISQNRCTIAFGQPFGYKLCCMRARKGDIEKLDLSCWRVAGVGAELIRADLMRNFSKKFAPAGFNAKAFLPCYGLAEATLGATFGQLGQGCRTIQLDAQILIEQGIAVPDQAQSDDACENNSDSQGGRKNNEFVNCGRPLPNLEIEIIDDDEQAVPDTHVGTILIRGPSIMSGYLNDPEESRRALNSENWLDTGDIGFLLDGNLYITGRRSDVIIINGRNVRAQDIEFTAEQQVEVREREASSFSLIDSEGNTTVVLVIECRLTSESERQDLIVRLRRLIYEEFGINPLVELVKPHTLPRTSSGKLSRSRARLDFIERASLTELPLVLSKDG